MLLRAKRVNVPSRKGGDYLYRPRSCLYDSCIQDVVIKVADEGGGIRRSYMNRIWSYLFTTADPAVQEGFINLGEVESDHAKESPLAGLG